MKINRKEFLFKSAATITATGIMPLVTGCSGIRRQDIISKHDYEQSGLTKEEYEILYYATLAPSGHNAQPWTVKVVKPYCWIIGTEKKRWLPAVDPDNIQTLLSVGAFVENIHIASRFFGYDLEIKQLTNDPYTPVLLEIRLVKGKTKKTDMSYLRQRSTVKRLYTSNELSGGDIKHLTGRDTGIVYVPRNCGDGRYLHNSVIESGKAQVWRNEAQEELAKWIRWSDSDARKQRNGLTPETMGIKGIAGWYVRHFYSKKDVLTKDFRETSVKMIIEQLKDYSGWIMVLGKNNSVNTLINNGRKIQRIFLQGFKAGIGLHPMTQVLQESLWQNDIAGRLGTANEVHFIMRAGYVKKYPEPVSLRMPVSRILKK